jgi:hypothetical protein
MFRKNCVDGPTSAALAKAKNAINEREKIARLIDVSHVAIERSKDQLQEALGRLGDEEASVALAEGEAAGSIDRVAQRQVCDLKLQLEALQARAGALEKRLAATEPALLEAEDELAAARVVWRKDCVALFVTEYEAALQILAVTLHKGLALSAALGAHQLGQKLRALHLPDLQPDAATDKQAVKLMVREHPVWRDIGDAREVYENHVAPRQFAETLERLTRGIRERKTQEAQREAERQAQTQPPPAAYVRPVEPPPQDLIPLGSARGPTVCSHRTTSL